MKDDSQLDDMIARAARDLAPPSPAPRDAIWEAIRAARSEAAAGTPAADAAVRPIPIGSGRPASAPPASARPASARPAAARPASAGPASAGPASVRLGAANQRPRSWTRWGAALAAMLVMGIGIGRMTELQQDRTPAPAADAGGQQTNAAAPIDTPADAQPRSSSSLAQAEAAAPAPAAATAPAGSQRDPRLDALDAPPITRIEPDARGATLARATRPSSSNAVVRGEAGSGRTFDSMMPYRVAATRHFSRAHTLLVAMPSDVRDGRINEVAARAADLLVNTRILLASPAAEAPELRRLLEDIELILAQAATISPTRSADDLEIINNAINQRDVLIRLHGATTGPRLSGI